MPKAAPKSPRSHIHVSKNPKVALKLAHDSSHRYIKSLESLGKMNVFWKRTCRYPKWLHNDPIVTPQAKLSGKLHQMVPKSHQTDPKITRLAQLFVRLATPHPCWTSNITRKNVYFLFTGPLGADNATIKPAIRSYVGLIMLGVLWFRYWTFYVFNDLLFCWYVSRCTMGG